MQLEKEYKKRVEDKNNREILINEGFSGITKMDTLPDNKNYYLNCPETEVYYFKAMRDFFKTTISHYIMERNQDTIELKLLKNKIK